MSGVTLIMITALNKKCFLHLIITTLFTQFYFISSSNNCLCTIHFFFGEKESEKRPMSITDKNKKVSYFSKLFQHEVSMNKQKSQEKFERIFFNAK
jgi:hypothetical protein